MVRIVKRICLPVAAVMMSVLPSFSQETSGFVSRQDSNVPLSSAEFAGDVDRIEGEQVTPGGDLVLSNTLQGLSAGLVGIVGTGDFGKNATSLYVRGLHTMEDSRARVFVDGMERSFEDIVPEEIDYIEVLKDASAKALYGSIGANGIINIRTKRGVAGKKTLSAGVEYGVMQYEHMIPTLDSYQYAILYNEALSNDGLAPLYSFEDLAGYRAASAGEESVLYPSVDFARLLLNPTASYRKAHVQASGGDQNSRYAVIMAYTGGGGPERQGNATSINNFNLRGNLDIRISSILNVNVGISGRIRDRQWGAMDSEAIFGGINTTRPNEYPLTIDEELIGMEATGDVPLFGASYRKTANLYARAAYGGIQSSREMVAQSNLTLNFVLDEYLEGLYASTSVLYDTYSSLEERLINTYDTYSVNSYYLDGVRMTDFIKRQNQSLPKQHEIFGSGTTRSMGLRGNVGYDRIFDGLHHLSAVLSYDYFLNEYNGLEQDVKREQFALRTNYSYDARYNAEFILTANGSNKFAKGDRFALSPTLGLSFTPSEAFKLRGSTGLLVFSGNTPYDLFATRWYNGPTFAGGQRNANASRTTYLTAYASPGLKWEKSLDCTIGVDGIFKDLGLKYSLSVFLEDRMDIIGFRTNAYSSAVGEFLRAENFGEVLNRGAELSLEWSRSFDCGLKARVGFNAALSSNRLVRWNDPAYADDWSRQEGKPTSSIFGAECEGMFGKDTDLSSHVPQRFGPCVDGDLAYRNINGDDVVDEKDFKRLGNTFPVFTSGCSVSLSLKNFGLDFTLYGQAGAEDMINNVKYTNTGLSPYSDLARRRYHPVNNPTGTLPRLTSAGGGNSTIPSSFYLVDCDFLKLKDITLSYTFGHVKLFLSGNNLFKLTHLEYLDPECISAGIDNYPLYRTFLAGITIAL